MSNQQIDGYPSGDRDKIAATAIGFLHLAAAPVFASIAVVTGIGDASPAVMLCGSSATSAIGGMTPMYLLMCLFHIVPWLQLTSGHLRSRAL